MRVLNTIEDIIAEAKKRPFDTYVLGPFMLWYGLKSKQMPPLSRKLLIAAGFWQMFYNWEKYRSIPEDIKHAPEKITGAIKATTQVV